MYKKPMLIGVLLIVIAGVVPVQAGLQDGLVSYFKLDEGSGTVAADASGNGHDGTLSGDKVEWVPGRFGGAVLFATDVDEAHVEFPTTGMSVSAGSISLWGYLNDPQAARTRYFFGHTTARPPAAATYANRIQIYLNSGVTTLSIGLGDTHAKWTDTAALAIKTWHHIVLTWDNGKYVVYTNGAKTTEGTYTGLTALDPIANISDDANPDEHEAFDGLLDEARIYNRAITAAEVKEIFQVPAAPRIKAWGPSPANGARDVTMPLFQWKALDTIKLHNVYVGTDPNLTAANLIGPRQPLKMFFYVPGLQPGVTYYWRVDEIDPDTVTVHTGDVWSFLAQPATAYDPVPANGTNTASPASALVWSKGTSALKHHLYFGDNLNAVKQGAAGADKGVLTETTFAPGDLQEATTYYWRVDEIGPGDVVKAGKVWSFTTVVPVDDFESYTDDLNAKTTIFDTWIDGYTNKLSGSTVGNINAPFAEQTIVHGGKQSMPLDYNNVNSPFYSEAERTFAPVQDWTANGVDTLVLYVRSKAGSKAAPVYVQLKDASNKTGMVVADAALVSAGKWAQWKIPLSEFVAAGVNLARVKTMSIGVGDRAKPAKGGTGLIFIDDIGLAKPAPAVP
jgi:hypothetical protein